MSKTQSSVVKPPFMFAAGTGVLRSKITPDAVMLFGRIALPIHGQCFVDGHRGKLATEMRLTVKGPDRKIIGELVLPSNQALERKGLMKLNAPVAGRKNWKVTAIMRTTGNGAHLSLRLPDIKIANPAVF